MPSDLQSILSLEVPIVVEIGRRAIALSDVRAMVPGSIIELPKGSEEELELLVNNKPIGSGIAVKVVENFGIQISYIGDLKARIEAMGGGAVASAQLPGGEAPAGESAQEAPAEDEAAAEPAEQA